MNKYTVWDANGYSEEESCKPFEAWDFDDAAERFAAKKFSDWDYPSQFELFVRDLETREVRFVEIEVDSEPVFRAATDAKTAELRQAAYASAAKKS